MTDTLRKSFVVLSGTEVVYADDVFLALVDADSREEVLGRDLTDFLTPGTASPLLDQVETVESGDAPALGKAVELRTVGGESREAVAVTSPVEWDGDERVQVSFLYRATDETVAGGTVQDRAMDEAPIGITISDPEQPDNPLVYVNDGFLEQTGYSRAEALGRNCRFLQGEGTREEPVARMRAAIDAEEPVTVALRNYRKDGSMFWNRVTIVPVTDEAGRVTNYVGYQEDVTDAKLHEQEKELFRKQAEATNQATFVTDREGTITYVNPAFEAQTGYTAEEAIGETPSILKSGEQDDAFYADLWETITAGEIWEAELTNETKGGERYEVEQTIVPITDDRGEITHFVCVERDVTDRIVREQTLNVLNRVLRHNLRSAITVIEGQAEMLEEELDADEYHAALASIQSQTETMKQIADRTASIRTLLQEDTATGTWRTDHLNDLLESYREAYPEATFELEIDIEETVTLANGDLFELALEEAVENAVVHSETGAPTVRVTVSRADAHHVRLRVADDGPGIPDNEREAIERGTETPLVHGTGIGLWIMKWVTARLGGTFGIEDSEEGGTVLTFYLPIPDR